MAGGAGTADPRMNPGRVVRLLIDGLRSVLRNRAGYLRVILGKRRYFLHDGTFLHDGSRQHNPGEFWE